MNCARARRYRRQVKKPPRGQKRTAPFGWFQSDALHVRLTIRKTLDVGARPTQSTAHTMKQLSSPGGHLKLLHPWPGQTPPPEEQDGRTLGGLCTLGKARGRFFQPPALAVELEQMAVVHQTVEQGRDDDDVAVEQAATVVGEGREDRRGEVVTRRDLAESDDTEDRQTIRGCWHAVHRTVRGGRNTPLSTLRMSASSS